MRTSNSRNLLGLKRFLLTLAWIIVSVKIACWSGSLLEYPTRVGPKIFAMLDGGILTCLHSATLNTQQNNYSCRIESRRTKKCPTYRKKCNKMKASVSRFGSGNLSMAAYISRTASWNDVFCVALQKSFHKTVGISGSRRPRRKSLMHPHNTWMSVSPRCGSVLPRMKRSWKLTWIHSPNILAFYLNSLTYFQWFDFPFWSRHSINSNFS